MLWRFGGGAVLIVFVTLAAVADDPQPQRAVAARIDGEPVFEVEAEVEVRRAYGDRKLEGAERQRMLKAALDQVVDRRLVLAYLTKTGQAASSQDVDFALAQYDKDLKSQDLTLDQHLKQVGLTAADLRRSLAWKLSWQRYLDKQLTEANLEKYFDRYRREFDGTQLRVAQILFKLPAEAGEAAVTAAKERAVKLKQEISEGSVSFADAAKQHSQAPSAKGGGDIGWIERHKPMPPDYSRQAYALKRGEIGDPILSPFGLHLITILEEKPGTKSWRDAEAELRPAVTLYLFRWIADRERPTAKIEYVEEAK
jgi:parvulin-like peptidyl-prolyl isomerase